MDFSKLVFVAASQPALKASVFRGRFIATSRTNVGCYLETQLFTVNPHSPSSKGREHTAENIHSAVFSYSHWLTA